MSKNGMMKRKSCDALDFSVHTQPKKDRAWYDQEQEHEKERTKDKKRLSFIGNIFSKMKSSSKLSSSTSSLHKPVSRTTSDENSFRSSDHSTMSVESREQKFKRNAHLKNFFNNAATNPDFSIGEGSSEADSIGSAGSLNTPLRADPLNRESELRHSSRSMPAPSTPHESTVRRAHSTVASVNDSPSIWLRRKSLRLRQRKAEPEMEELKEEEDEEVQLELLDDTQASSNPSQSASFHTSATPKSIFASSKIDRSKSAAAYSTRQKVLQKRAEESPVCFSTSGTPEVTGGGGGGGTMPKRLNPSTGSASTLQKFGAALKRGFSSGSRAAQRTPRNGSQTTDALVTVMRRPTMDKKKPLDTSRVGGRRMSDISSYGDVSMLLTPRNADDSSRLAPGFFDTDMTTLTGEFSTKVSVPMDDLSGVISDDSFDAVVVDVAPDGAPLSEYSGVLLTRLGMEAEVVAERGRTPHKKSGVIRREQRPHYVIFVVVSDADRGRQLRVGYEAALNIAFATPEINKLMLPQLFCTSAELMDEERKFGDSILRSTFMAFVRGENHTKIDSIVVVANDVLCASHLNECLDKLVSEKVSGRMHQGLTGSSFRR